MAELLVLGKRSVIGRALLAQAAREGVPARGVGREECDLRDPKAVRALLQAGSEPRTVAFLAVINKPQATTYESFLDNLAMAQNVAAACRGSGVRSLVYFSSVDVYGARPALPISESTPIAPDSWYSLAKVAAEFAVLRPDVSCPVTVLRLPGVYGTGHGDTSVLARMLTDARAKGAVTVRGSGKALRDYLHTEDLGHLVFEMAERPFRGVLNVATGRSHSILDLADRMGKTLSRPIRVDRDPADDRDFDLVFNTARLKSTVPRVRFRSLEEGLASLAVQGMTS